MSGPRRIASRDNPAFKALRILADNPRAHGRAVADGIHLVRTCLERGIEVRQLLVSESGQKNAEIVELMRRAEAGECLLLTDSLFKAISGIATPVGIAAVFDIPREIAGPLTGDSVMLDAVQDAGNVGAILRTAAAAGVRHVLLGPGCAGAWTQRVLRAGQGAHFSLAIHEQVDLLGALANSPATSIATVVRGGACLHDIDLTGPKIWLVGNEGAGLSAPLAAAANVRTTIPLARGSESLNVSAAVAVCLFEAVRQRRGPVRGAVGPIDAG